MEKSQDKGFRIFGEEPPEIEEYGVAGVAQDEEEVEAPAVQSSGSKSVFIAVFTFCVLGALMFFGYYNLNNRMTRLEATGVNELRGLSDTLETRFAEITKQNQEQNAVFKKQIDEHSKKLQSSTSSLTDLEKNLHSAQKSAESNITSVASKLEATAGRISSVESGNRKAIDLLEGRLAKLNQAIDDARSSLSSIERVRESVKTMQSRIDSLSSQVKTLASNRVDSGDMDQQFYSLKKDVNKRVESSENQLEKQIYSLKNDINALEAMIRSVKSSSGSSSSTGSNPPSGHGSIIEQDVQ